MKLEEMLGEAYHDGMTIEEINSALSDKKFADLSTGKYVDVNKYNADIAQKDTELSNVKKDLNARLTDSEKAAASVAADKARIQELEKIIKNQTVTSNRDRIENLTSDVRTILGIDGTDADYLELLDSLSTGETENVKKMASYINKIAKDSYEKGKKDASKDNLGKFADGVGKDGSKKEDEVGSYGKQIASLSKPSIDPNLFFKR